MIIRRRRHGRIKRSTASSRFILISQAFLLLQNLMKHVRANSRVFPADSYRSVESSSEYRPVENPLKRVARIRQMPPTAKDETQSLIPSIRTPTQHFPKLPLPHCSPTFIQSLRSRYAFGMKSVTAPHFVITAKFTSSPRHVEEKLAIPDSPVLGVKSARPLECRPSEERRGLDQHCPTVHVLPGSQAIGINKPVNAFVRTDYPSMSRDHIHLPDGVKNTGLPPTLRRDREYRRSSESRISHRSPQQIPYSIRRPAPCPSQRLFCAIRDS